MKDTEGKDRVWLVITTRKQGSLLSSVDLEHKKTKDIYINI